MTNTRITLSEVAGFNNVFNILSHARQSYHFASLETAPFSQRDREQCRNNSERDSWRTLAKEVMQMHSVLHAVPFFTAKWHLRAKRSWARPLWWVGQDKGIPVEKQKCSSSTKSKTNSRKESYSAHCALSYHSSSRLEAENLLQMTTWKTLQLFCKRDLPVSKKDTDLPTLLRASEHRINNMIFLTSESFDSHSWQQKN